MLSLTQKNDLEKKGYRLVGNHSAVKVCHWVKNSLLDKGFCYKQKFYGIESHRCLQMTPALPFCTQRCIFCWRDINNTEPKWRGLVDEPSAILDGCIKAQRQLLQGFGGNPESNSKKFKESMEPNQVAISLAGEPTMYPKLAELIQETKKRKMTSFLVSNGNFPLAIEKLLDSQPTNLYLSLDGFSEKSYKKICQPLINDGWERVQQSLNLLKQFQCNTVIRTTLIRDLFGDTKKYAKIYEKTNSDFIELKAFMSISYARNRLPFEKMPTHDEVIRFAEKISEHSSYKIKDEQPESRVVLLAK